MMYTFKDSGKTVGDLKDGDVVVLLMLKLIQF